MITDKDTPNSSIQSDVIFSYENIEQCFNSKYNDKNENVPHKRKIIEDGDYLAFILPDNEGFMPNLKSINQHQKVARFSKNMGLNSTLVY